jgi:hypothetical protein
MHRPRADSTAYIASLKDLRAKHANDERALKEKHLYQLRLMQAEHDEEERALNEKHANELECFFARLEQSVLQIQAEVSNLREKKREWDLVEQRVNQSLEKLSHSVVKLNVGGRIFAIPKDTLLRYEGSYFHAMLSREQWKPDVDNGIQSFEWISMYGVCVVMRDDIYGQFLILLHFIDAYFIDADPTLFEYVMAYLREGDLSCEGLPPLKKQRLMKTLDYLNLEVLQWDASASVGITDGNILISEDKRTVSFTLSIADESGFIQANHSVERVSIQIVSTGNAIDAVPTTYIGLEAFKDDGDVDNVVAYNVCSGEVSLFERIETTKGQTFSSGDILTITYNRAEKSVQFAKNGLDMGICIDDVPDKKYFPYVDSNCDGICLSLAS